MTVVTATAGLIGAATSAADPVSVPAVPDVASYPPVNPSDYTVNAGKWYGFAGPAGTVCVLDTLKGDYGCAGLLPGAPEGINLVSAGPTGVPKFTATGGSPYADAGAVRPLPPGSRLSFRSTFCGMDKGGTVACLNTREGTGFVVGPDTTWIISPPPPPPPAEPAPPAPDAGAAPAGPAAPAAPAAAPANAAPAAPAPEPVDLETALSDLTP